MKIQQCRLFFKAATSNTNQEAGKVWKRCFRPCGWIPVMLSAALLGCSSLTTSLTPDRVQVLSQIAGQAVYFGVGEWLKKHPGQQSSFEAIYIALSGLVKATNYNEDAWTELLSSLPVNALEGPNGALYVSEGLVVWDAHLKKGVAVRQEATPAVLKATYRGLRNAVWLPKPPVPGKEKSLKGILPDGNGSLPDAVLDEQFRALTKRTNQAPHEFPFLK